MRTIRRMASPAILLILTTGPGGADAQPLNKETFHEYLNAVENMDEEALKNRFYHQDFKIQVGENTIDVAGLLAYENQLKSLVDFHFDVRQIVADESGIAVDLIDTFDVKRDADVPNIGQARKGEKYELHFNSFYTLKDGKILTMSTNLLSVRKIE